MPAKKTAKKSPEAASEKPLAPSKKAVKGAKTAPAKPTIGKKIYSKKTTAKKTVAKTPESKKAGLAAKVSLDTIARAAYLNYRRRVENGLPGDSHGDWLDAEQMFSAPK